MSEVKVGEVSDQVDGPSEVTVQEVLENILDRLGGLEEAITNLASLAEELCERQEDLITAVGDIDRGGLGFSIES